jgi:hypothetical protein
LEEDEMIDMLFEARLLETAARQLAAVLASATEWNLTTLERLEMRKSTSKADLHRQRKICDDMVAHCKDLGVPDIGLKGRFCGRLSERLARSAG